MEEYDGDKTSVTSPQDEYQAPANNKKLLCILISMISFCTLICCGLVAIIYLAADNNPKNRSNKAGIGDFRVKCEEDFCHGHGRCYELYPEGLMCDCYPGYDGEHCTLEINECNKLRPCIRGTCIDLVNGYRCECEPGFSGLKCEINEDDCTNRPKPCYGNGDCYDQDNGFVCRCDPGYVGERCETQLDLCSSRPCNNDGICTSLVNNYTCSCKAGFTGPTCGTDINECADHQCVNGECIDLVNGYTCKCQTGWMGTHCDVLYLPCAANRSPLTCLNGGKCNVCTNTNTKTCVKNYECDCSTAKPGYYGEHCADKDGTWSEWAESSVVTETTEYGTGGSCTKNVKKLTRSCVGEEGNGLQCQGDKESEAEVAGSEQCTCVACGAGITIGEKLCSCDISACTVAGDCCDDMAACPVAVTVVST